MARGFKIKWDQNAARKLERLAQKGVQREVQRFFDRFTRQYRGQPVEQVKSALQREWSHQMDGQIIDPELTEYATIISDGGTIEVQ